MDKYVNTDIGIYHVEALCDRLTPDGHKLYHVRCLYCDFESDMRMSDIKYPKICKHKSITGRIINFKPIWNNRKLKNIFDGMLDRCYNKSNKDYRWYGEKGITICNEWLDYPESFEQWALKNGYEDGLTIDRKNSDDNYCPENCQWITQEENSRKAGNVNWITVRGETLTGRQWAQRFGLNINLINRYIRLYGRQKVCELINAMLDEYPSTKHREYREPWFSVYGINV